MKLLYIAGNRPPPANLDLETEITELQRSATTAAGEPVECRFLPRCTVEQLSREVSHFKPDVLHLSGHGGQPGLELTNSAGESELVSAERLRGLITPGSMIQLAYLSCCNSTRTADILSQIIPLVVGFSGFISDVIARQTAVFFYDKVFEGHTVKVCFEATEAMLGDANGPNFKAVMVAAPGTDPTAVRLYRKPQMLAKFVDDKTTPDKKRGFPLDIGLAGCPDSTTQTAFFTDDEDFIDPKSASLAEDLCWIVRGKGSDGIVWESYACDTDSDFRLVACVLMENGCTLSACSNICDALYSYYTKYSKAKPTIIERALEAANHLRTVNREPLKKNTYKTG